MGKIPTLLNNPHDPCFRVPAKLVMSWKYQALNPRTFKNFINFVCVAYLQGGEVVDLTEARLLMGFRLSSQFEAMLQRLISFKLIKLTASGAYAVVDADVFTSYMRRGTQVFRRKKAMENRHTVKPHQIRFMGKTRHVPLEFVDGAIEILGYLSFLSGETWLATYADGNLTKPGRMVGELLANGVPAQELRRRIEEVADAPMTAREREEALKPSVIFRS